jgi:hypothetical protein
VPGRGKSHSAKADSEARGARRAYLDPIAGRSRCATAPSQPTFANSVAWPLAVAASDVWQNSSGAFHAACESISSRQCVMLRFPKHTLELSHQIGSPPNQTRPADVVANLRRRFRRGARRRQGPLASALPTSAKYTFVDCLRDADATPHRRADARARSAGRTLAFDPRLDAHLAFVWILLPRARPSTVVFWQRLHAHD